MKFNHFIFALFFEKRLLTRRQSPGPVFTSEQFPFKIAMAIAGAFARREDASAIYLRVKHRSGRSQ